MAFQNILMPQSVGDRFNQGMAQQLQSQALRNQHAQLMGALGGGNPAQQGAVQQQQAPQGQPPGVAGKAPQMPGLTTPYPTNDPYAQLPMRQRQMMVAAQYPEQAKKILDAQGLINKQTGEIEDRQLERAAWFNRAAMATPPGPMRNAIIGRQVAEMDKRGQDSTYMRELYSLPPDQQNQALLSIQAANKDVPTAVYKEGIGTDGRSGYFNIAGGQAKRVEGITPAEKQALVNVSVGDTEAAKLTAKRDSLVIEDMTSNARIAAREKSRVRALSRALQKTKQGAYSQYLPELARIVPGLDATNEQVAQTQITNMAIDMLQKFKGPTTDFEFRKAEETQANLGNSPEANRMIIRNLDNAIKLVEMEKRQFDDYRRKGGQPGEFVFNTDSVIVKSHPQHGDVTIGDVQQTAHHWGLSIDETIKILRSKQK